VVRLGRDRGAELVEEAATAATAPELTSGWFSGTYAWVTVYAGLALGLAMLGAIIAAVCPTTRSDALAH
jgi:hypothetical protein